MIQSPKESGERNQYNPHVPGNAPHTLNLLIEADPTSASLLRMRETIQAFAEEHDLPEPMASEILLALEEVVTNIIRHSDATTIEVRATVREADLLLEIIDDAPPFDPRTVPPPELDVPLERRRAGGLGVHLVRCLMDAVEYERVDDRNHLRLRRAVRAP